MSIADVQRLVDRATRFEVIGGTIRTFRFLSVDELIQAPRPNWTVRDIIPERGIGVIWGASGSGKTFAALDLACAIARGISWHGREVMPGTVLYVATEGRLALRLGAYIDHHQIPAADLASLRILESRINLLDPSADLAAFIDSIHAAELSSVRLVIIDTLNRAMPGGNENASQDMGRMVDAAASISAAINGAVVFVHHSGKEESKGSRGHSSLKAAADFEVSIRRDGEVRAIQVEKVRDAEDAYTLVAFSLIPVGDSVVLSPTEAPAAPVKARRLTPAERIAIDSLHRVLDDRERRREAPLSLLEHGAKQGQFVALIDDWRTSVYARIGSDQSTDAKRKTFLRARERLTAGCVIHIHEDFVWLR